MKALVLLVLAAACSIPTEADVRQATGDAVEQCRQIIRDELPDVIDQVTRAAVSVCAVLQGEAHDLHNQIDGSREVIVHTVLNSLGCGWDGKTWDCSTALICGKEPP